MTSAFLTDTTCLPTLNQLNPEQATKMMDLCKEMEGLIDQTNNYVTQMLKSQQNSILNAFKQVLELMKKDFEKINEKFQQYVIFHEQESQVVNAQNKMAFFRSECHVLNEQCKTLKNNLSQMTKTNQDLENELMYTKQALFNSVQKNLKLKKSLQQYKDQANILISQQQEGSNIQLQLMKSSECRTIHDLQQQINTSIKRGRTNSYSKQNVIHQHSFNSVETSNCKQKTQQTRAQSLQKSLGIKRSSLLECNILDSSLPTHHLYEYSRYESLKEQDD